MSPMTLSFMGYQYTYLFIYLFLYWCLGVLVQEENLGVIEIQNKKREVPALDVLVVFVLVGSQPSLS